MLRDFWVILLMLSPIAESRIGIPVGLSLGMSPLYLLVLTALTACAIYITNRLLLMWLYSRVLCHWTLFEKLTWSTRVRGGHTIQRYGYWGLLILVAVPLPTTGVYAGTLVSWFLNMSWLRTLAVVVGGALISGMLVTLVGIGVIRL